MRNVYFLLVTLLIISSCSGQVVEVKSPCVSINDGPCGKKIPINSWWLEKSINKNQIQS